MSYGHIVLGLLVSAPLLGGCTGTRSTIKPTADTPLRIERSGADLAAPLDQSASTAMDRQERAVLIDGSVVGWDALTPLLAEAAGGAILEEIALERVISRQLELEGITLTDAMVRAEEQSLLDELANVGANGNRSELLDQVRRTRGLGPKRFDGLLRRNAGLRALLGSTADPEPSELELARRIAFGPTYTLRLFVADSDADASGVRERTLGADPEARPWIFARACLERSTHPTSARGGLIDRFSPDDPAYPDVVRDAVIRAGANSVSPVLVTGNGFAVVFVEAVLPRSEATAAQTQRVDRRVRIRKQRIAMERLAQTLLARSTVSPIDPDLARAWRARSR